MMTNNTPVSLVQTRMRLTREDSLVEMQMRIVTRMMMPTAIGSSWAQPTSMRKALESCAAQNHPRFKTAFLHPFFLSPLHFPLSFFLSCCFLLVKTFIGLGTDGGTHMIAESGKVAAPSARNGSD